MTSMKVSTATFWIRTGTTHIYYLPIPNFIIHTANEGDYQAKHNPMPYPPRSYSIYSSRLSDSREHFSIASAYVPTEKNAKKILCYTWICGRGMCV